MQQVTVSNSVVSAVLASINNGSNGIENPVNWPWSAKLGVSYSLSDKQFPQVEQSDTVVYFDNASELLIWLDEKRNWIKGTDYDFSMSYSVYQWDWGPVYKYTKSM